MLPESWHDSFSDKNKNIDEAGGNDSQIKDQNSVRTNKLMVKFLVEEKL